MYKSITIRPSISKLVNYESRLEERYSQWPLNNRNFRAYGFTVRVIKSMKPAGETEQDLIMHEGQVPTVAFLKNNDGTMVQLGPFKEKLIIGCPNNFLGLMEGDVIRSLNGVVSPSFELLYRTMCSGETLDMKIIRNSCGFIESPMRTMLDNDRTNDRLARTRPRFDIKHLPDVACSNVASYISFIESLIFAAAMPQSATPSIIGTVPIRELDFLDLDSKVTKRLNDNDMKSILLRINAVNRLVSLKLTNCYNIIGHGLSPLSGSKVLNIIDLSLVPRMENAIVKKKHLISATDIMPILHSIIRRGTQCQLKCVQYPAKWLKEVPQVIQAFQQKFENSVTIRRQCTECNQVRSNISMQSACYMCLKGVCNMCDVFCPAPCNYCQKRYCDDCVESYDCSTCGEGFCVPCMHSCETCGTDTCHKCIKSGDVGNCNECGDMFCGFIFCKGGYCDNCEESYCHECYPISRCYYCNKSCCLWCNDYGRGDVLHCVCTDKPLCSQCLARREDPVSLCQDCVTRADRYLDGCLWR